MTLAERTARARWPGCIWDETLGAVFPLRSSGQHSREWDPEHSNDDAMELVAEMRPTIMPEKEGWRVWVGDGATSCAKLPREAICLAYLAWAENRSKT